MEKKNKIAAFFLFALLAACGAGALSPGNYMSWIEDEDNACIQKKTIGSIDYIGMYKPLDYVVLKELGKSSDPENVDTDKYTGVKKDFEGMEYYSIKMGAVQSGRDILLYNIATEQEYYERVNYYTVNAQNDIFLVQGSDTLPCELYHYERTYGVSPYNNILLGFATNKNNNQPAQLHFNDKIFNSGLLIFSFNKTGIPRVKIN
jgi:hypothetical protein